MTIGADGVSVRATRISHRFNDDLLANEGDLERAAGLYPDLVHVLDHPELRQLFSSYDVPANKAKGRSRIAGCAAVALVTISLLLLALEPILRLYSEQGEQHRGLLKIEHALVYVSAVFAVVGAVIGLFGVLFRRAKSEWLHRRLMTERLRQFHFQTLVRRIPEIVASLQGDQAIASFIEQRKSWLAAFRLRHEGKLNSEFGLILEGRDRERFWLHPAAKIDDETLAKIPANLFAAYRELRIVHQLQYASYRLGEGDSLLPALPRPQADAFSRISMIAVVTIVALHIGIGFAVFRQQAEMMGTWLASLAIMVAIVGLAIRTLEEGLKPEREVERYRHYQFSVLAVCDRFEAASSPREKISVMEQMERLVSDEMCDFIETHAHARFVM